MDVSSEQQRQTHQKHLAAWPAQRQLLPYWISLACAGIGLGLIAYLAFSTRDSQARNFLTALLFLVGIVLITGLLLLALRGGFERLMNAAFEKLDWFNVPQTLRESRPAVPALGGLQDTSSLPGWYIRTIRAVTALPWVFLIGMLCAGMVLAILALITLFSSQTR